MKYTVGNNRNKRYDKKQINIKWNSNLFFQVGIVVSLLTVFFVMQMDFEMRVAEVVPPSLDGIKEPPMIDYVVDIDKPKPIIPQKKAVQKRVPIKIVVKTNTFEVKPDTAPDIESSIAPTDQPVVEAPSTWVYNSTNSEPVSPRLMSTVEFVPVFPGCENLGTNAEKVKCMSSSIDTFINRNFRKGLLANLDPSQTYRVYVNFKIDSKGFVTDVTAKSHHAALTKEAQRVISTLPSMKPGRQGDKNVDVLYTVPIVLRIQ